EDLLTALNRASPLLEAADLVGTCGRYPLTCACALPGSAPLRFRSCSARTPRLDGVRPAAPGRGTAAARRPGGVPAQAPARCPPPPRNASPWSASSTT